MRRRMARNPEISLLIARRVLGTSPKATRRKMARDLKARNQIGRRVLTNTPKDDGKKDNNDSGEKPADHKESLGDKANGVEH
jgi:hypothetical protein